jgi:hypothetical protein
METMHITDYESLLTAARQQSEPQRLLFVFLQASLPKEPGAEQASRFHAGQGGELQPVMSVDKALDELGSFADLVTESERTKQDWQIVLVAALSGRNGVPPSSNEAEQPLKMMMQAVETGGDLSRYMAFDRAGTPVQFG